jgi:hypothetical protein
MLAHAVKDLSCYVLMFIQRASEDQDVVEIDGNNSLSDNISFIIVWNGARLLVRPKYITSGSKRPQFVQNATLYLLPSWIWTLLYPHCMLSLIKWHMPFK